MTGQPQSVLFIPAVDDPDLSPMFGAYGNQFSAIITHQFPGDLMNLTVFDPVGGMWFRGSVPYLRHTDPKPPNGFWCGQVPL